MDAHPMPRSVLRSARLLVVAVAVVATTLCANARPRAAGYRTTNFVVSAPTPQLAREFGDAAERLRREMAMEWLGKELPTWSQPCPITARVSPSLGAGGATSFVFDRGEVFGWEMNVQGSRERILDSVLPHEVTHTIFASHFRQPLPRWADEGACTTVEDRSEIVKQERLLIQFLKTYQGIPFSEMFAMKEYPDPILPLYAQGHSLTQYLLERRGKAAFIAFLEDGMRDENWRRAVQTHYGHDSLYAMQNDWLGWVRASRPRLDLQPGAAIASATRPAAGPVDRDPVQPAGFGREASVYGRGSAPAPGPAMVAANTPPARKSVYSRRPAAEPERDPQRGPIRDSSRPTGVIRR
ncbi:MAG: hypothetical protein AAF805_01590 [Planctomycetota bacterium]